MKGTKTIFEDCETNTIKIFLENILHGNFDISEHYEEVHTVRNQFMIHQYNS